MTEDQKALIKETEVQLHLNTEERKEIVKEAIREWMEEKYKEIGKWTVRAFFVGLFGALVYFMLIVNGWKVT